MCTEKMNFQRVFIGLTLFMTFISMSAMDPINYVNVMNAAFANPESGNDYISFFQGTHQKIEEMSFITPILSGRMWIKLENLTIDFLAKPFISSYSYILNASKFSLNMRSVSVNMTGNFEIMITSTNRTKAILTTKFGHIFIESSFSSENLAKGVKSSEIRFTNCLNKVELSNGIFELSYAYQSFLVNFVDKEIKQNPRPFFDSMQKSLGRALDRICEIVI